MQKEKKNTIIILRRKTNVPRGRKNDFSEPKINHHKLVTNFCKSYSKKERNKRGYESNFSPYTGNKT